MFAGDDSVLLRIKDGAPLEHNHGGWSLVIA